MEEKGEKDEKEEIVYSAEKRPKRLLFIHEAPEYLRHNAYILSGYRGILNTKLCIER